MGISNKLNKVKFVETIEKKISLISNPLFILKCLLLLTVIIAVFTKVWFIAFIPNFFFPLWLFSSSLFIIRRLLTTYVIALKKSLWFLMVFSFATYIVITKILTNHTSTTRKDYKNIKIFLINFLRLIVLNKWIFILTIFYVSNVFFVIDTIDIFCVLDNEICEFTIESLTNLVVNFKKYHENIKNFLIFFVIVATIPIVNILCMLDAINIFHELGNEIGILTMFGASSNVLMQYLAFFGRFQWKIIYYLTILNIIGMISLYMNNLLISALFISFPFYMVFCFSAFLPLYLFIYGLIFSFLNHHKQQDRYLSQRKLLFKLFPEEYINDRNTQRKRWQKQGFTTSEITIKTLLCDLGTLRGLLLCKIENIWLDKNRAE